jgi:Carboxypeptidase regulatory-like domain
MPHTRKLISALFIYLLVSTTAFSQETSTPGFRPAAIVGTALDTNGGVVPYASVILQSSALSEQQWVTAQDNGFFKLDGVKPGSPYRVIVRAPGFEDWTSNDFTLHPGEYRILTSVKLRIETVETTTIVVPPEVIAAQQVKAEEKQRIMGFIPNFYVVYDRNAVPMPSKLKFQLAFRSLVDPVTVAGFFTNAALYQAASYPSYGQGAKGFGQRLGATFAGGYTNVLVGDAVLPSLLHQDPRYFYQGTGSTKSRLMHALASPFITRGDEGRREINYSNIGGDLASGAIANAYYPSGDRGAGLVCRSALIGAGGRMANAVLQEFLLHKLTSRHAKEGESFDQKGAR